MASPSDTAQPPEAQQEIIPPDQAAEASHQDERGPEAQHEEGEVSDEPTAASVKDSGEEERQRQRRRGRQGSDHSDPAEAQPPLPVGEEPPPLPDEAPPSDGWEPVWDGVNQTYYFYNRLTGVSQWENPRVPGTDASGQALPQSEEAAAAAAPARPHGGYNPAIHGDYDPNADYAIEARAQEEATAALVDPAAVGAHPLAEGGSGDGSEYAATGAFNRFTGHWQSADQNTERHGDEAKSRRQMSAYFDVDAAANSHGGRSLKAERQNKKLSQKAIRAFKEKRKERKEEKRRAWLRD